MAFNYNPYSKENNLSQWARHIQNESYIEEITNSISKINNSVGQQTKDYSVIIARHASEMNETIKNASKEQIAAIQHSTSAICGTLESGFTLLSDDLQEISFGIGELRSELNRMASMLDWKLSLLIESVRISNLLLKRKPCQK